MIYLQYSIRSLYLHKKCQIKHYDFHLLRGHRHSFQIQFKPIAIKLTINHIQSVVLSSPFDDDADDGGIDGRKQSI